jgi:hypothetical protein
MYKLFDLQNWKDLFHEDGFSMMIVALLVFAAMTGLLFSDNLKRWRAQAQERAKWLHWNRR